MPQLNSPVDVLKLLDKSNCRQCGLPTCLAFSAGVIKGQKKLSDCPNLSSEVIEEYTGSLTTQKTSDELTAEATAELKKRIAAIDLAAAAERLEAPYANGRLTVKCFGKDFSVDTEGNVFTDLHVNAWITGPVYNYILYGQGVPASGNWVPLRELKNGRDWYRFFAQRCEKPLKKVADTYPDVFEDMVHIFSGKEVDPYYQSDISLILRPLPKLPMLVCYWRPEDGLESSFNLFFDSTAEENLIIDAIYVLGAGLAIMFEKLAQRHG